jgi:Holliday junction resolvasome RuvABC endonuclease subunit
MFIIGIDPASVSGFNLLEVVNGEAKIRKVGKLELPKKIFDRLSMISELFYSLKALVVLTSEQVDVVIEDQHYQGNPGTLKALVHIRTLFQVIAIQRGYNPELITPKAWRSILGFKSFKRADVKKEAVTFVKKMFNLDLSEDAAEAVCISVAWWAKKKGADNV